MKKIVSLILVFILFLSAYACGVDDLTTPTGNPTATTQTDTTLAPGSTSNAPAPSTPLHTHSYSNQVTTTPTCGKAGIRTFTCACGDHYTEKIAATGLHTWGNWTVSKEPSPLENGLEKRICSVCTTTDSRTVEKISAKEAFCDLSLSVFMRSKDSYCSHMICADHMLDYAAQAIAWEGRDNSDGTLTCVDYEDFIGYLFQFDVTDSHVKEMRKSDRFSFDLEGYDLRHNANYGTPTFVGFDHYHGNLYHAYYSKYDGYSGRTTYWRVLLSYNAVTHPKHGYKVNKYLSISQIDSLPNNIIR
ncbi:MAG: hypothetical protein J6L76_00480 [Clostridia bacterium]|nr:hypothetical protein [Clostridia bacterium]